MQLPVREIGRPHKSIDSVKYHSLLRLSQLQISNLLENLNSKGTVGMQNTRFTIHKIPNPHVCTGTVI